MSTNADAFEESMSRALAASRASDFDEAMRLFAQASAARPDAAAPHFLMGAELAQAGRIPQAEASYANAVLLAPEFAMARYQLGLLQFTSGRPALALVTWQPLFGLPDTDPLQRMVSAFAALAADAFDECVRLLKEAISLNTDNPPLNADARKVIHEIERSRSRAGVPNRGQAPQIVPAAEAHVLLSNYERQGPRR